MEGRGRLLADGQADPLDAPPPALSLDEAAAAASRLFGVAGTITPLGSERDQNFRIDAGGASFVLKISNPADDPAVVDMQTAAIRHIAERDPDLPVPRVHPTVEGSTHAWLDVAASGSCAVRLLTYLDGRPAGEVELSPRAFEAFGAIVARTTESLADFSHPADRRMLLWDVQHLGELRPFADDVLDERRRAGLIAILDRFERDVGPTLARLPRQVIHNDLTFDNVLVDDDGAITGIIDFGDMAHTARVCDLSSTLASVMRPGDDPLRVGAAVLRGYLSLAPLEGAELDVLPDLIEARLAMTLLISARRVRRYPENAEYITGWDADASGLLELFDRVGVAEVRRRLLASAGPGGPNLVERRRRLLGSALSPLTYDRPLHLVRGEGVWLIDADGRRYLDAYNNVPVVGHGHPRVVEAVARQTAELATNTRYLYGVILDLAERLSASMPAGLDTCMFVNSGSEANDLAWRLATAASGKDGAVVTENAYHGVTAAIADLSPEVRRGSAPEHVALVPAPDGYRGPYRRDLPGWDERYARHVAAAIAELLARGHGAAAFVVDPLFTSDGIHVPPASYLPSALAAMRDAGGLLVADEVQAGFGRTGSHRWSFAASDVSPDVVTLGKPMGNGFPVAAVVTRAEIVDRFAETTEYFSTFGGNPVACAAAMAVLDVIEEEGLQARAAEVGAHLDRGLRDLAVRHPLIGDVRGAGLLIGVELVRPDGEPATRETASVLNAMRDAGVLLGTTGARGNVLKVRPPLVFTHENAERLLSTLDEVLASVGPA